jgi:aspartate/methionine/tyrosine aminotransferase
MKQLASRINNIQASGIRKYFDVKRDEMISLGSGTIEFDRLEHVYAAARRSLDEDFIAYTTNAGIIPLREAIVEKLARENGIDYTVEEVLVTCGSSEAMAAVPLAVLEPGDEAIIFDPAYSAFAPLVELANGKPVWIPTQGEDNWNPDPEAVERAITPRTKLVFLNSPANPTGAALSRETTEALAEIAIKHDLYVLSDELYEKVMFDGKQVISPAALPGMRERTFTINGFSKGFGMTGWRVGYVACPAWLIAALIKAQQYASICAPAISQKAALAALTGPKEPFERMLAELDRRRHFVVDTLNGIEGIRCEPQDGTFYTFADARDYLKEKGPAIRDFLRQNTSGELVASQIEQFTDFVLLRGNVALTAGSAFGPCAEGWFRVSSASKMETLQRGLARLEEALSSI